MTIICLARSAHFMQRKQSSMDHPSLPESAPRGTILLVSGGRRAGKSTLLFSIRQAVQAAGLSVGGLHSPARFEDGTKTGIDLVDAATGQALPLAEAGTGGTVSTGRYSFDPAALAAGLAYAERGKTADVFLVDELGPLELVRGEGWAGIIPMLRQRTFGVALVVVRPELLDQARAALDLAADSPLIQVDEPERDTLATCVSSWLIRNLTAAP